MFFRLVVVTLFFVTFAHAADHSEKGTNYGEGGINTYAQMKHGPDGALFLDPYFLPYLQNLEGQILLDAGCGAGPWSILAAKNGAVVFGIDIQEGMIKKAKQAACDAEVENSTSFIVGDVGKLPYPDNFFDRAISINVGCNLPHLKPHLQEMHRTLKEGGIAIITAPTCFGTVFTDGKRAHTEVIAAIEQQLVKNGATFPECIQKLDEVYRATFVQKNGQWRLVLDETELYEGSAIYRKIPSMVVPNYYHSDQEYLSLLIQEGFCIKKVYRPCFAHEQERQSSKDALGKEYVGSSAFVIFVVEKAASRSSSCSTCSQLRYQN